MFVVIVALESELSSKCIPAGVQVVHAGVGKINAALATQQAIVRHQPRLVLNYGTAGRISARAHGLLQVQAVIQRDMQTEPLAPRGVTPFSAASARIESGCSGIVCASGDSFVTAPDPWLVAQGVDVVDMELFAVAEACRRQGVAWRGYKFVTDGADEGAADDWQARVGDGEALFLEQLEQVLAEPGG